MSRQATPPPAEGQGAPHASLLCCCLPAASGPAFCSDGWSAPIKVVYPVNASLRSSKAKIFSWELISSCFSLSCLKNIPGKWTSPAPNTQLCFLQCSVGRRHHSSRNPAHSSKEQKRNTFFPNSLIRS